MRYYYTVFYKTPDFPYTKSIEERYTNKKNAWAEAKTHTDAQITVTDGNHYGRIIGGVKDGKQYRV